MNVGDIKQMSGIEFKKLSDTSYDLYELNYDMSIGTLELEEGPGWILNLRNPPFLDMGNLNAILNFYHSIRYK